MDTRTRFAPSPTGFVHIGSLYQALFDKTWAIKNNGKFILRIEDTDRKRFVELAENAIYPVLEWANLVPDESPINPGNFGPYRQSERLGIYQKYVNELINKGYAYHCFCSPERLEEVRNEQIKNKQVPMYDKHCRNLDPKEAKKRIENGEKYVVRMKIPENTKIVCQDLIRGPIEFDSNGVDDQVILKSDGFPTYHLAVVVDDHLMNITHVVRGPEWIPSFPKHKLLYEYFGWPMPLFFHTPMITNMDGSKLSKRNGHSSVDWYIRRGFDSKAVINFISLLGWSHPEEKEIFTYDEFVKEFDFKDVSAVSPKFDLVKLEWMNGQYIHQMSSSELIQNIVTWLNYCFSTEYHGATEYQTDWTPELYSKFISFIESLDEERKMLFADINKERIKKFEDLLLLNRFFIEENKIDIALLSQQRKADELKSHLKWVLDQIESIEFSLLNLKELETKIKNRADELNWKIMEVFFPIRIAICRNKVSPPLFESIYILGKENSIKRIKEAIDHL